MGDGIFGNADPVGDIFAGQFDREAATRLRWDQQNQQLQEKVRLLREQERAKREANAAARSPYVRNLLRDVTSPVSEASQPGSAMPGTLSDFESMPGGQLGGPPTSVGPPAQGPVERSANVPDPMVVKRGLNQKYGLLLTEDQLQSLTVEDMTGILGPGGRPIEPVPQSETVVRAFRPRYLPPGMSVTPRGPAPALYPRNAAELELAGKLLPQVVQRRGQVESSTRNLTSQNYRISPQQSRLAFDIWKQYRSEALKLEQMLNDQRVARIRGQTVKSADDLKFLMQWTQQANSAINSAAGSAAKFATDNAVFQLPPDHPTRRAYEQMAGELEMNMRRKQALDAEIGGLLNRRSGYDTKKGSYGKPPPVEATPLERRPDPNGVMREKRADGYWYPVKS